MRGGGESFDSGTVAVFLAAALTDFHDFFHHLIFRVAVINSTVVHRFQKGRQLFWRLIGETRIWCLLRVSDIGVLDWRLVRGGWEGETRTSLHLVSPFPLSINERKTLSLRFLVPLQRIKECILFRRS